MDVIALFHARTAAPLLSSKPIDVWADNRLVATPYDATTELPSGAPRRHILILATPQLERPHIRAMFTYPFTTIRRVQWLVGAFDMPTSTAFLSGASILAINGGSTHADSNANE